MSNSKNLLITLLIILGLFLVACGGGDAPACFLWLTQRNQKPHLYVFWQLIF